MGVAESNPRRNNRSGGIDVTTLRVVQIANEKFAIQRRESWPSNWYWCEIARAFPHRDIDWNDTWCGKHAFRYCVVDTLQEVEMALENVITAIKKSRIRRQESPSLKIIKVIKKVKV